MFQDRMDTGCGGASSAPHNGMIGREAEWEEAGWADTTSLPRLNYLRPQESTYLEQQSAQSMESPGHQGGTTKFWTLVHLGLRFLGIGSL